MYLSDSLPCNGLPARKTFSLQSPRLCPNRVCPTLNSIHSDFGAKRKFLPNLENFRLSWPGTLRKNFFRQKFFFSARLGYVLIVFARPQIVSTAILGPIGVGRQTWKIFGSEGPRAPETAREPETLIAHNF